MVSMVAATGDLFLASERTRVTLDHLRKKLRFRPYVSPDPLLEDLDGRPAILHPAHLRTFLVIPREPLDQWLPDLVWKTVQLLLHCPQVEVQATDQSTGRCVPASPGKRSRLVTDPKRPFVLGTTDFLAIVRIKPAHGKGEILGVRGRNGSSLARRMGSRLPSRSFPVLNPGDFQAPVDVHVDPPEAATPLDQLPWLRC